MNHILTIIGARPQFVKAAVVSKALKEASIKETIIHTGQHYDTAMSDVFWNELGIPKPEKNLASGSGRHAQQTALIMTELESYLLDECQSLPDGIMVYGDTNSTIAAALVASKLHIPIIHVEAGLRSFNRKMPEEINRILTDHVSNLLFCSSEAGASQLQKEGIHVGVHVVGDVMYDAVSIFSKMANQRISLDVINQKLQTNEFYLATIHRPYNTDDPKRMQLILDAFGKCDSTILWPVHPRNKSKLQGYLLPENLIPVGPQSYFNMLVLLQSCTKVITDSGGLQKEAYWLKKACVTVRTETEWTETLHGKWNQLCGHDISQLPQLLNEDTTTAWKPIYGDANSSIQIAKIIKDYTFSTYV